MMKASELPTIETKLPTDEEAHEFAVMIQSGLPAAQAILYFIDANTPDVVQAWCQRWQSCRAVNLATTKLMKKKWQDMTPQEKMDYALELHYNQLALMLFATNYMEANAQDKVKMDDARKAIEAKLAGTAGQVGALEMFYSDLRQGKIKLNTDKVKRTEAVN